MGVALNPVAAFELGAVHGGVGVFYQCGHVRAVMRVHADANAGADKQFVFARWERCAETGQ